MFGVNSVSQLIDGAPSNHDSFRDTCKQSSSTVYVTLDMLIAWRLRAGILALGQVI